MDWRIEYKRKFLASLINKKRYDKDPYQFKPIDIEELQELISRTAKERKLDILSATNALINEVREGKEL